MSEHTRTYGDCTITLLPGWRFLVKELDRRYDSVREAEAAIDRAEANLSASRESTLVDRLRKRAERGARGLTPSCDDHEALREAADEIERLQADRDNRIAERDIAQAGLDRMVSEVERCRDAIQDVMCDPGNRALSESTLMKCQIARGEPVPQWHVFSREYVDGLQADVEGLTLTWSDEPPTEPGWYWYFHSYSSNPPEVAYCEVHDSGVLEGLMVASFASLRVQEVADMTGQWAGPIPEPQERPE